MLVAIEIMSHKIVRERYSQLPASPRKELQAEDENMPILALKENLILEKWYRAND